MARKKKTEELPEDIQDVISVLKKINTDSDCLSSNSMSIDNLERIDTGNYAFNAILSGSLYGGIPVGLITGLSGPSSCGKSLIAARVVANAQKQGYFPIVWDSEGAWDSGMKNLGVDLNRCYIMPVATVEDVKNQMLKVLSTIKAGNDGRKYIFILDSLGALSSQKELEDSSKEKTNVDMGTRAKAIKAFARQVAIKCKTANVPMLFTNHTYENPGQMYPTLIKNQSGGSGPQYLSSVLVQFRLKHEKVEKNSEVESESERISGVFVPTLITKNRGAKPFLETTLYINFTKGLDRYSGLFELATQFGVIVGERTYQLNDGTKLGYRKDFENDPEVWEKVVMPKLEEYLQSNIKYKISEGIADFQEANVDALSDDIGEE